MKVLRHAPRIYYTTNHLSATMARNFIKGVFEIKAKWLASIM